MKEINLGSILAENRRKRGLTQEALAAHMGVSKGAVSKWETGSSLPDISLLPQLASYFGISVDQLIGYQPQMEKGEIRNLYLRLARDFSLLPFGQVLEQCLQIAKKYYSCHALLFALGVLLVNHCALAVHAGQGEKVMETALKWFDRAAAGAQEASLRKQALQMKAYCLVQLGRPSQVLDILDSDEIDIGPSEPLLARAYQMTGKRREAKSILQGGIYKGVVSLVNLLSVYLDFCQEGPGPFAQACRRVEQLADIFQLKALHPGLLLSAYLAMAQGWMQLGDTGQALALLQSYTDLAAGDIYPLRLHGDEFFDLLDEWLDHTLAPGTYPPREEGVIRRSMTQALEENPVFSPLQDNPRFQNMVRRLRANAEVC